MSTEVGGVVEAGPSRRWLKITAGVAAVVVLVAGGLGLWWWTHPTLFGDLGDTVGMDPLPVPDAAFSSTVIFPNTDHLAETVTFTHLEAVFSKNTANAEASFWICHLSAGESPIGAVHDPESYCRDIVPAKAGTAFDYGTYPDGDYLFVTITPTRAGVAKLSRIEITYARGIHHFYQRGTESIRAHRWLTAT